MTLILHVAVPCPLRVIFDYLDIESNEIPCIGMRVLVPFGSRKLVGIIVAITEEKEDTKTDKLKSIIKRIDKRSLISPSTFDLIQWVSDYYHHPLGECFQAALPKKLRLDEPADLQTETYWKLNKHIKNERLGKKQQQILVYLEKNPDGVSQQTLFEDLGTCRSSLLGLHEKQLISPLQKVKIPLQSYQHKTVLKLSKQQQSVVDSVWKVKNSFKRFLLHGITGSGKTEVYIHLAQKYVDEGKQILILIPEINLTTQFVERFRQQLTANIVVMNSAISDSDRKQAWLLAKEGLADVVIGTRSAIFTPLKNLALIIVDEEHDSSYKQQDGLRYHARSVALIIAQRAKIPILLGSATPSLESLYNVEQGRYTQLTLTERATGASLPKVRIVDSEGPAAKSGLSSIYTKQSKNRSILVIKCYCLLIAADLHLF
jgi:primosomal protein N' (replication factor Y)